MALSGDKAQRFLHVADGHNERIEVLDRQTLTQIPSAAIGHPGPYPGQFFNSHVMASDAAGNLYVGEGGGRVQKFLYKGMAR